MILKEKEKNMFTQKLGFVRIMMTLPCFGLSSEGNSTSPQNLQESTSKILHESLFYRLLFVAEICLIVDQLIALVKISIDSILSAQRLHSAQQ